MVKVKAYDLQKKNKKELLEQLDGLKKELASLRVAQVTGAAANRLSQIKVVRKNIARVLTVYNQKARQEARNVWEKKKYLPIDLRYKKTRAIRRALTTHERTQKTLRQQKKDQNFPQRRFALKA